jgi:hypothetical protein
MDELLNQVAEKTGLPLDKAQDAIDAVLGFLKDKLPDPIAAQPDKFLGGNDEGADDEGGLGDLLDKGKDMLGGMFGNKGQHRLQPRRRP